MMLEYPHPIFYARGHFTSPNESDHTPRVSSFPIFRYYMHDMRHSGALREKIRSKNRIEPWLKLKKSHLNRQDSLLKKMDKLYGPSQLVRHQVPLRSRLQGRNRAYMLRFRS